MASLSPGFHPRLIWLTPYPGVYSPRTTSRLASYKRRVYQGDEVSRSSGEPEPLMQCSSLTQVPPYIGYRDSVEGDEHRQRPSSGNFPTFPFFIYIYTRVSQMKTVKIFLNFIY
jgi:hypothetical protein